MVTLHKLFWNNYIHAQNVIYNYDRWQIWAFLGDSGRAKHTFIYLTSFTTTWTKYKTGYSIQFSWQPSFQF